MYDSRTDASRYPGRHTYGHAVRHDCYEMSTGGTRQHPWRVKHLQPGFLSDAQAIAEGLADYLAGSLDDDPAPDCEVEVAEVSRAVIERAHAEALDLNELAAWERELLLGEDHYDTFAWSDEVEQMRMDLEVERQREEEARYDEEFGGYTHDDQWMPFARGQEVYDLMDAGFHVITPNKINTHPTWMRATEKEKQMSTNRPTTEELQALNATREARARKQRLAAQLREGDKAKVRRPISPMPVPHAERPEPSPEVKFGGNPFYDTSLDPISPDFKPSSWR